jgi:hypothetical protein
LIQREIGICAQIESVLAELLESSASILVLWTRSHRGSLWSGLEVDLFESKHPTRPIFVVRLDNTPWAAPNSQWIEVASAADVTRTLIREHTTPRVIVPSRQNLRRLDVLLRPRTWTTAVRRLRSGSTVPELLALRRRAAGGRRPHSRTKDPAAVLRSAAGSVMFVMAAAVLLGIAAFVAATVMDPMKMVPRHVVFVLATIATTAALLALQAPLPAIAPATLAATVLGLATQLAVSAVALYNVGAGAGGGAVLGTLCGSLFVYASPSTRPAIAPSAWRVALRGTMIGTAVALFFAALCIIFAANELNVRGLRLILLIGVVVLPPALGLWAELAGLVRGREALLGVLAAVALLLLGIVVATAVASVASVDQQKLRGGLLAGTVTGLCAGAIYTAPGAVLARRGDSWLRTLSSIATLSFTLLCLWLIFEWMQPGGDFTADLRRACPAYVVSFPASAVVSHSWLWLRDSFFGVTATPSFGGGSRGTD